MKKILLVFLISFLFIMSNYGETLHYSVGDKNFDVNVPKDYENLRLFYKLMCDNYFQSENSNLEMIKEMEKLKAELLELKKENTELLGQMKDLSSDFDKYKKDNQPNINIQKPNVFNILFGGEVGYKKTIKLNLSYGDSIVIGANILFGIYKFYVGLGLDFGVVIYSPQNIDVTSNYGVEVMPKIFIMYKIY